MAVRKMIDQDLAGKRTLIRQDLNTPLKDGKVSDDTRIRASIPTIQKALDMGALVMVMSHLGRPKEGECEEAFSLAPVAAHMQELLGKPVRLVKDWLGGVDCSPGEVALCENVRFVKGEKADDEALGKKMAALCDVYVMDAFGTAHRAQASTHAVAKFATVACAGPLLVAELEALGKVMIHPARPLAAIVGGAKVSSKLTILEALAGKVDHLIVGGGIANNFLAAAGKPVGKSLYEPALLEEAKMLMTVGAEIPIPVDVIVAKEISATARPTIKKAEDVAEDDMILDIGPETAKRYAQIIKAAGSVLWNGPIGVFEYDQFAGGTKVVAHAIAESKAFSVVGGGDVVAAVEKFGYAPDMSYISTGGGAFLEVLEGKTLPAFEILQRRAAE